jgi:hypothetical protein
MTIVGATETSQSWAACRRVNNSQSAAKAGGSKARLRQVERCRKNNPCRRVFSLASCCELWVVSAQGVSPDDHCIRLRALGKHALAR